MKKRLYRTENDKKMIGGVCGGIAEYFTLDPSWVRLGFAVILLCGGFGLLMYLLMWIIVPTKSKVL